MTPLGIHHIVPPYLLDTLARNGALDREYVDDCLRLDEELRHRRGPVPHGAPPPARATEESRWTVHTAHHTQSLPGDPVRSEGEPESGDAATDEAASGITATLDLYRDTYQRDSYDGAGALVELTVHYGQRYANAFWDGSHLVFGDGDGQVFGRFTRSIDVLAHEFTHAVTERTAGLAYEGQSGALNESVSDALAICVKQQSLGQTAADGNWLIGEELFLEGVDARGLRDMLHPGTAYDDPKLGKDPQPAHMDDYVETTDDNGGVHINSGIPNRAFALAAQTIGGTSAEGAGRVWYAALTGGEVGADTDFTGFAAATVAAAGEHADAVRDAWDQVGVAVTAPPGRADTSPEPGPTSAEPDSTSAEPDSTSVEPVETPAVVVVRRSGGIAGQVVEGSVDATADDERAHEVRVLLERVDLRAAAGGPPHPDRYVYAVRVGDEDPVQVNEAALTDDLRRLVDLVLG